MRFLIGYQQDPQTARMRANILTDRELSRRKNKKFCINRAKFLLHFQKIIIQTLLYNAGRLHFIPTTKPTIHI
jgi:hypothetical protein